MACFDNLKAFAAVITRGHCIRMQQSVFPSLTFLFRLAFDLIKDSLPQQHKASFFFHEMAYVDERSLMQND